MAFWIEWLDAPKTWASPIALTTDFLLRISSTASESLLTSFKSEVDERSTLEKR
jgi:hypothetical protein